MSAPVRSALAGAAALPLLVGLASMPGSAVTPADSTTSVGATSSRATAEPARGRAPFKFGTVKYNQWYATQYMKFKYGWGPRQRGPLIKLWTKESGWSQRAHNGSSGAHGIPQSLPGSKMASHGRDWRTNPETQIKWGLSYIKARYGTPSRAWAHSQRVNWY